jgi:hypothetical protein
VRSSRILLIFSITVLGLVPLTFGGLLALAPISVISTIFLGIKRFNEGRLNSDHSLRGAITINILILIVSIAVIAIVISD